MSFRAVSTFWIAHPNNNLINNAAAGSQVNNTKVHLCFFAFLFVSVLVYRDLGVAGRAVYLDVDTTRGQQAVVGGGEG